VLSTRCRERFLAAPRSGRPCDGRCAASFGKPKVRYIGFSDLPAWKVSQAQTLAHFRGWAPIVAVQLEYSVQERTAEGELVPMAQEMGMGVMPWSPLRHGLLSGKFRRDSAGLVDTKRAAWACRARRIMWSSTRSAPWPTRLARPPPPWR
jgi:aryl-alcohol dehydrogenase-like predicted oxidoreductase